MPDPSPPPEVPQPPPVDAAPEEPLPTEHEKVVAAQKLEFRKRAARHEAAHVIVGDAIGEDILNP